jgi:hypothetical protein
MAKTDRVKSLHEALSSGGDHVGDLIWWNIKKGVYPEDDVVRAFTNAVCPDPGDPTAPVVPCGLDPVPYMPVLGGMTQKALKARLNAAITEANLSGTRVEGNPEMKVAKKPVDGILTAKYLTVQANESIVRHFVMSLDLSTGALTSDDPSNVVSVQVQGLYDLLKDHLTSGQIGEICSDMLYKDFRAIALRSRGGVYWVPGTSADKVRALKDALKHIGSSQLAITPLNRGAETTEAIGTAVNDNLLDDVEAVREKLRKIMSETDKNHQDRTFATLTDELKESMVKAGLYRDVLAVNLQSLMDTIKTVQDAVDAVAKNETYKKTKNPVRVSVPDFEAVKVVPGTVPAPSGEEPKLPDLPPPAVRAKEEEEEEDEKSGKGKPKKGKPKKGEKVAPPPPAPVRPAPPAPPAPTVSSLEEEFEILEMS